MLGREDVDILEEIGHGGAGIVHKALERGTAELLAVKLIRLELDEEVRKRIITELRLLSNCQCEYIVEFRGAWFANGEISIAMEFMDAGSMLDIVALSGPVPERILATVALSVLRALDYLKTRLNMMHRDIKPANILMDRRARVKVCDLGVSGSLQNSLAMSFVGTTSYMAPERIDSSLLARDDSGCRKGYDITADVFSLGLSLVELAFGRYPFPILPWGVSAPPVPLSYWALLDCMVNQPAPTLPPDVFSPELCSFVDLALKKRPAERASPSQLLQHDFARIWQDADTGAAAWIAEILDRR